MSRFKLRILINCRLLIFQIYRSVYIIDNLYEKIIESISFIIYITLNWHLQKVSQLNHITV